VAALAVGAAGGGVDAALNTAVALSGQSRLMNVLHSAYGVGAALGPLMVTAAVAVATWRAAYAVVLAGEVVLVASWWFLRPRFPPLPAVGPRRRASPPGAAGAAHRRLVWAALTVFFVYTGVEVGTGAWAASYLRGPGGLSPTVAGLAVFAYWAGLAGGRLAAAGIGHRCSPETVVRVGTLTAVAAAAGLWARPTEALAVVSLAVLGAALGPVFPALVTLTPRRLGEDLALDAVGWQLAAAGVGGAVLSALIGVVLQLAGLKAFGPTLVALAVGALALNVRLERLAEPGPTMAGRLGETQPSSSANRVV
jgi:fucose permease